MLSLQRFIFEQRRLKKRKMLSYARAQRNMLISQGWPGDEIGVSFLYLPADILGGDMFGCIPQSDGNLCFYAADVSGKGRDAAKITFYLADKLRAGTFSSAADMLTYANNCFLTLEPDELTYVAMFAVMLNPSTGNFTWSNAGLNTVPLLAHTGGLVRLYAPGAPLCCWKTHIEYNDNFGTMPLGSRLLIYTDGLIDPKSSGLTESALNKRMLLSDDVMLLKSIERNVQSCRRDDVCALIVSRRYEPVNNQ